MESAKMAGFPLTTIVGTPWSVVLVMSESTVGSSDVAVESHAPSTYRIEPLPNNERPEAEGRMVTDDVNPCRSITSESRGLETPRTYTGVTPTALAKPMGCNASVARTRAEKAIR